MSNQISRFINSVLPLAVLLGCTSTGSTAAPIESPSIKLPEAAETPSQGKASSAPEEVIELAGCESSASRDEKLKVLNTAVDQSDLETQNVKDGYIDSSQRDRLALLSAGLMPDDVPFVSVDRTCWSHFYRAHRSLIDGKEAEAKKAANSWRICLNANFPNRAVQARKLFQCFGLPDEAIEGSED